LRSEAFAAGETFTDFVITHFSNWKPGSSEAELACIAYIIDDVAGQKKSKVSHTDIAGPVSPWQSLGNWRR
ncbi:MAG: acetyl-CoA carboxylase biotin carboxylase subunit, partial [Desulfomonilia bacterium]|nr:acetyl-CoA carboxylase biotin carboxylase subunit [Desulfomonilia bacterium]